MASFAFDMIEYDFRSINFTSRRHILRQHILALGYANDIRSENIVVRQVIDFLMHVLCLGHFKISNYAEVIIN